MGAKSNGLRRRKVSPSRRALKVALWRTETLVDRFQTLPLDQGNKWFSAFFWWVMLKFRARIGEEDTGVVQAIIGTEFYLLR